MIYCPTMSIKLFRFVDQLLSSESSRTIIHTFVNLFHLGAITDENSFTLAKQFYFELAQTLNLQYGNILLATSTNAHLQAVVWNDWPVFANRTDLVGKCVEELHCDGIEDIFQKHGMVFFSVVPVNIFVKTNSYRCEQSPQRAVSPPSSPDSRQGRKPSSICTGPLLLLPGRQQPPWTGKT